MLQALRFCLDSEQLKVYVTEMQNAPTNTPQSLRQKRDDLIMSVMPHAKFLANQYRHTLPGHVSVDDLVGVATIGAITAADRYDECHGVKFKSFADQHIRGAILDELRRIDTLSRWSRDKHKAISSSRTELSQELGRKPYDCELAEKMSISLPELHKIQVDAKTVDFLCIDDPIKDSSGSEIRLSDVLADDNAVSSIEEVFTQETKTILASIIETLPKQERLAVTLYYYEEMNLREAGLTMGLTESRVCQVLKSALDRLKKGLHNKKMCIFFSCIGWLLQPTCNIERLIA